MSIRLMTIVWSMEELTSAETLVMLALADNASDDGRCFPSVSNISKRTRMSDRGVQKCISELVAKGHLTRYPRHNQSTVYFVHPRTTFTTPPNHVHPTPEHGSPPPRTTFTHNHHLTVIEPSFVPDSAKPVGVNAEKSVTRKRRTGFQQDELPAQWRQYLEDRIPDAHPEEMFCNFRDHHLKLASTMADWGAAWRTWVQNVTKGMPYVRRISEKSLPKAGVPFTAAEYIEYEKKLRARSV